MRPPRSTSVNSSGWPSARPVRPACSTRKCEQTHPRRQSRDDEAEALLRIEELNDTLALADDLGRHAATTTAAATEAAATAAAEAATTAAATESAATAAVAAAATAAIAATAAAIAAAAAAITTAAAAAVTTAAATAILEAATEAVVAAAKTVALVSAAPAAFTATPSVENHAVLIFPAPETVLEPTRWATRNGFGAKHWRTALGA
jgi:hypothetical protein